MTEFIGLQDSSRVFDRGTEFVECLRPSRGNVSQSNPDSAPA